METASEYAFILELRDSEGLRTLYQERIGSMARLAEHARYEAQCRGLLPPGMADAGAPAVLAPVWAPKNRSLM